MKRQSIYTENDEHTKLFDTFDKLVPKKLDKAEQVAIPQTFKPTNISVRRSGAFNDFNKKFKDVRGHNHPNKFRLLNYMGGNNGKGLYKHNTQDYFEKDETLKIKYKMRKIKEMLLDPVETERQEQRTTEGTEIKGQETMLNKNKAQADINKLFKQKRNRGGRSGGKDGGAYQGGFSYTGYDKDIVKKDNEFKKLNAEQDEFRSIISGEIENSGGNANIVQMPE
tara:strand:- start:646 stop:1317 length:672 start_codon:yes stop_codon:yes gene_type:complete